MDPYEVMGVTDEMAQKWEEFKAKKGRRDQRVCVCGHGGGAHYTFDGSSIDAPTSEVGCQAGKVPCMCNRFFWVLTATDIRSFIQKTEGPGEDHALMKGLISSRRRGIVPEWREGFRCFHCKKEPSEVGVLIPIAYNEKGGEAMRSTPDNRLHCSGCRQRIASGDFSVPE